MTPSTASKHPADALIACHACDALIREPLDIIEGATMRCPRCDAVLIADRGRSTDVAIACAVATILLMAMAFTLPLVTIEVGGALREARLLDAVVAAGGAAWPLAVAVAAMIAAAPLTRAAALIWTLAPIRLTGRPAPGARAAFRLAIELRPWSMVEIFVIGVVVALVKVVSLASVDIGSAFWVFACLAAVAFFEDATLCRRTVWRLLS